MPSQKNKSTITSNSLKGREVIVYYLQHKFLTNRNFFDRGDRDKGLY